MDKNFTKQDLIDVAMDMREPIVGNDPTNRCFMTSVPIAAYFIECFGIECSISTGWFGNIAHTWIDFSDGRVLDATGEQFNENLIESMQFPEVYFGEPHPLHELARQIGLIDNGSNHKGVVDQFRVVIREAMRLESIEDTKKDQSSSSLEFSAPNKSGGFSQKQLW